jgi:hypothetical protein
VSGVRQCQCPCYKNHVEYTELCKCNNCNNPLRSRSAETHSVPQKRKTFFSGVTSRHPNIYARSYMLESHISTIYIYIYI